MLIKTFKSSTKIFYKDDKGDMRSLVIPEKSVMFVATDRNSQEMMIEFLYEVSDNPDSLAGVMETILDMHKAEVITLKLIKGDKE